VSIDMSPAFIKGVTDNLPDARITFDKFHVIAHASQAVDKMRRLEQKTDPALKGLRWALLKDRSKLSHEQATDLDKLVAQFTTKRTARAWLYREQLRDILDRKQINVVSAMLKLPLQRSHRGGVVPINGRIRKPNPQHRPNRRQSSLTWPAEGRRLRAPLFPKRICNPPAR
jgi:transposase